MSRSYKKAIIKDRPRNYKKSSLYWRKVRRVQKQALKQNKDIPNPKTIVNDYDYCDYKIDYEYDRSYGYFWYNNLFGTETHRKNVNKFKRK